MQDGLLRTRGEYAIAHKLLDEVRFGVCVGWGWSQNSQGTHGRLATCFGPYPKTFIYLYYLYLVSRMVFRFFGNFFPNTYIVANSSDTILYMISDLCAVFK